MDLCPDLDLYLVLVWIAFFIARWKPEWANSGVRRKKVVCYVAKLVDSSLPPKPVTSPLKFLGRILGSFIMRCPSMNSRCLDEDARKSSPASPLPADLFDECSCSTSPAQDISNLLTEGDLKELWLLVEEKDGGLSGCI